MKKSRKDDVINAANCIMRTDGYSNLSFAQISKNLGVTRENIHHYFKKKELLGLACVESMKEELEKKLSLLTQKDTNAIEKINEYFHNYKWQKEDQEDCPIASFLSEYHLLPQALQTEVKNLCTIEQKYLELILTQGIEEGSMHFTQSVHIEAMMIISQLKGAVGYAKIYNNFPVLCQEVVRRLSKVSE